MTGGSVASAELAEALICEALRISWTELQATPAVVIAYRLAIKREALRIEAAKHPLGGGLRVGE